MRPYAVLFGVALLALAGCSRQGPPAWQGYLEGEFVYVGSPLGGTLDKLSVSRGDRVEKGAPLFTLEAASETDAVSQAQGQLTAAQARLADLQKGSRPSELAALEAKLGEAQAAEALSKSDLDRQEKLFEGQAITASDLDHARLSHEQSAKAVEVAKAQLETAGLGGRADAVQGARADLASARAAFAKAQWNVQEKGQFAPEAALVYDTLYRVGEYVNPGSPVVSLLPPGNLKVRFFVTDDDFTQLKPGDPVLVTIAGHAKALEAKVTYRASQPEYTPPVLYNRDNRSKLVFMIEAALNPADARDLPPGQPVDVSRGTP